MANYFFTSDTHFFHEKIITYSKRPYLNRDVMNKALVENWNNVVGPKDIVYHLGDFALYKHSKELVDLVNSLNGKIIWLLGNHDKISSKLYDSCKNIHQVTHYLEQNFFVNGEQKFLVMSHYPLFRWNKSHYGSYNLHGHCHGGINNLNTGTRRYDVGVDCNNYAPIELYSLISKIDSQVDLCLDQESYD